MSTLVVSNQAEQSQSVSPVHGSTLIVSKIYNSVDISSGESSRTKPVSPVHSPTLIVSTILHYVAISGVE